MSGLLTRETDNHPHRRYPLCESKYVVRIHRDDEPTTVNRTDRNNMGVDKIFSTDISRKEN